MKKDYDITLRGHHLMTPYIFCFAGGEKEVWRIWHFKYDYSKKHTKRTIKIARRIANSDIRVKILNTLDVICKKCKTEKESKFGKSRCMGHGARWLDRQMASDAGLEIDETYSSKYILEKLEIISKNKSSFFYRQYLAFWE